MSIDDLIRSIEPGDENNRFKIILEMLISIETSNRSIIDFLIHDKSEGDKSTVKTILEDFEKNQLIQREYILQKLYERFGSLPDDLLLDNHE